MYVRLIAQESPRKRYAVCSDGELARLVANAETQAETSNDPVVQRIAKDSRDELNRRTGR